MSRKPVKPAKSMLSDRHPTGKSPTTRGAPNGYYLVASGHPGKNSTAKLYNPAETDDKVWAGVSPFLAINDEAKTRSAAIRTTIGAWISCIMVDAAGDYHIDFLTWVFLAWIWQMTRLQKREFAEIPKGSFLRFPFNKTTLTTMLREVVTRTFPPDVAARIINGSITQLRDIEDARKTSFNADMLPFAGIKATKALAAAPAGFVGYVRSLIAEHPLEMSLAIAYLHNSPPVPPLPVAVAKGYSQDEVKSYEDARKQERMRIYAVGRLALTSPIAAMLEAQRVVPISHPIDPRKIVQPLRRALESANCFTPLREEELAVVGSLPKKLSRLLSLATQETFRSGGVDLTVSPKVVDQITAWQSQMKEVDPDLLSHQQTEEAWVARTPIKVIDALTHSFRIVMLPTVFKTTADFFKVMVAAKMRDAAEADRLPVPSTWYEPDALIPKRVAPANGAVGIIVRAGKVITWATLGHCWSGGYTTVFVAVQPSRAAVQANRDNVPLASQLLRWGQFHTELICGEGATRVPVCCKPYLLARSAVQAIVDQPQCKDEATRLARLEEHSMVSSDVNGGGVVSRETMTKIASSTTGTGKRKREIEPVELPALLQEAVAAKKMVDKKSSEPSPKRPKINLNRFVPQPRGTRPKNFLWDPEKACYMWTKPAQREKAAA